MKRHRNVTALYAFDIVLFVAAAAVSASAIGCSGSGSANESDDDTRSLSAALEEDNGGLSTSDEAPSFGDPSLDEAPPLADDPGDEDDTLQKSQAEDSNAPARVYRLAHLWGHMPPASDAAEPPPPVAADFSGSLSIDAGAIGVSRALRFDGRDHLEPRTSLRQVSFVSHTLPRVDGLMVTVRVPEGGSPIVHFATAALTTEIDVSSLEANVGGIARAGDGANGVTWLGFEDRPGCTSGFLAGRWKRVAPGLGRLQGQVVGDHGALVGHVKGLYGHARKIDQNVFFGKYIDRNGAFRGLFGGTYGDGAFRGRWGTIDPREAGALAGFISDGTVDGDGRGVFIGRFQERCGRWGIAGREVSCGPCARPSGGSFDRGSRGRSRR
jgi:hypothetical protein